MKIAFIVTTLGLGGTENWVELSATELAKRGHQLLVIAEHAPFHRAERLSAQGVDVRCFSAPPPTGEYTSLLRCEKPQIVHVNVWERMAEILSAINASGIPAAASHHAASNHKIPGWLWKASLLIRRGSDHAQWSRASRKHLDAYIGCCRKASQDLRRLFGNSPRPPIFSVPNAISLPGLLTPRDVIAGPPRILQVGGLVQRKRPDLTIKAFVRLQKEYPDGTLTFVGDGPLRRQLEELAKKTAPRNIIFAGPQHSLSEFYADANIMVLPSTMEGLPYVLIEAAARGIPLIGSRVGGVPEIVRNDENGLLVKEDSLDALTSAMRRLASDPDLRVRMGLEGRKIVEAEFEIGKHIDELLAVYQAVIDCSAGLTAGAR